jgi:hypothetical protein
LQPRGSIKAPSFVVRSEDKAGTRCCDVRFFKLGIAGLSPDEISTGGGQEVDVLFIASVAVVAADPAKSRELYVDALGLPLAAAGDGGYFYSERIDGSLERPRPWLR